MVTTSNNSTTKSRLWWAGMLIILLTIISIFIVRNVSKTWRDALQPVNWTKKDVETHYVTPSIVPPSPPVCRNTQQGKLFVTDERGYICRWQDTKNGCCTEEAKDNVQRFSCDYCNDANSCCVLFEYCVSCCLNPDKRGVVLEAIEHNNNLILQNSKDTFEFCLNRCRTSSSSLQDHKTYLSNQKHCFGAYQLTTSSSLLSTTSPSPRNSIHRPSFRNQLNMQKDNNNKNDNVINTNNNGNNNIATQSKKAKKLASSSNIIINNENKLISDGVTVYQDVSIDYNNANNDVQSYTSTKASQSSSSSGINTLLTNSFYFSIILQFFIFILCLFVN